MARPPDRMREAAEEAAALVSSAESVHRLAGLCRIPSERARMRADRDDYLIKAVKVLVRLHLPEPRPRRSKASQQLKLVA